MVSIYNTRVNKLRDKIKENDCDAAFILQPENIRYVIGFTGSTGLCLITANNIYLFTDFRYIYQAYQEVELCEVIDCTEKGMEVILKTLKEEGQVSNIAFEEEFVTYKKYCEFQKKLSGYKLLPCRGLVEYLRKIKDSIELEYIKKAANIADEAFNHIINMIKPGVSENDIALELEHYMRKNKAEKISFPIIVASGWRSSLPHGTASNKVISYGELIVLDFGAVYAGYNSDMTRTICVGNASEKQKKIYNIVLEAQERAVLNIKPGMSSKEADATAREFISKKGYGEYFGHGLGHGVGLSVHEAPTVTYKNSDNYLQKKMVFTIEPGIYIPQCFGVRIEDTVVMKEFGVERLTKSPKKLMELC